MTRLKLYVLTLGALLLVPAAAVAQTDVTGDWLVTLDSPQGAVTLDVSMKQAGEVLTGTLISPMGSVDFKGKIAGDTVEVAYSMEMQGQSVPITMNGKVTGDSIAGNFNFGGLGDVPWSAKRKPAGAAATTASAASSAAPAATASSGGASGGITGKWDITINMAGNAMPASATLAQAGDKVTGTLSSQAGETPIAGTITGNSLKLEFKVESPQGVMDITMTGDLAADGITGKMSLAGLGDAEWTGKRAK
jgi:hypothetical protein